MSRSKRIKLRNTLRVYLGDNCFWCGLPMEFPEHKKAVKDVTMMASIEHHIQKQKSKVGHNFYYLKLCHVKCNI